MEKIIIKRKLFIILTVILFGNGLFAQQTSDIFTWPDGKKTAISLTFDDARLSQVDKGIPLLDKYDVKGTFYVSPDSVPERISEWKVAIENGHETGNDFIKKTLGIEPVSFAYPCGQKYAGRGADAKREGGGLPFAIAPIYKNPTYTVEERVKDLLSRMTLEEKIGQMNMPCVYGSFLGNDMEEMSASCKKLAKGDFMEGIGPIGGFFTLADNILQEGPRQQAYFFNELQELVLKQTRLGIPLLQTEEGTHGLMCSGGTIFPEGASIGSTWNMDLVRNIYSIAAKEARSVGIHQLYTLVIEPNRDPRMGRNEEGYSEDPYLCSRLAEAIVEAIQGNDISASDKAIAGLCHYPGQSEPVGGIERGAMEISERKLREVFLPPWVAGIKKGGALGVMATYPAIDGIPTHASEFLLTHILRGELGFEGLVLSEGGGISTLLSENVVSDQKQAGELALKAGLDVGISFEDGFLLSMIENVQEGKVSLDLIDRAVARILKLKFRLGLFENPYVDPEYAVNTSHTKENQGLALDAATEGIVLLKNENRILPLQKNIEKIAIIGPNADNDRNQLGDYISEVILQDISTILEGIKARVSPNASVEYVKGCNVIGNGFNEISKAVKAAGKADIAVVVLGENERHAPDHEGTNGERRDVASLDLTGIQEDLLKAVYETGTPTILVLINGRPLSIPWAAEHIPAIVEAWLPGERGGEAVAGILFGDYNPSGKLPITIPRHVGQLPVYYNHTPSRQEAIQSTKTYVDMPASPLWEFGFGLSYTNYTYDNLRITPQETGPFGEVKVYVDVINVGEKRGSEVVQLYVRDLMATVTSPIKELKGFSKIMLEPGEMKTVEFVLDHESLALYNRIMEFVVEPGIFEVMVGSSSEDIRLEGRFEVKDHKQ
ncbi:MAG: glycoside hydrolase family 3 C-terminal domain-containing protein [Bacteroidota bacterium]